MTEELDRFVQVRRDLHKIPEPGFREYKTQNYVLNFLKKLPQGKMEIRIWKTGVFVKIHGRMPAKMIGYRTDMDGLPIQEKTGLGFQSEHEGMMHACGHDFHMSIALGLITHFVNHPVNDDLLFIFQPAEEGPGGAEPMMKSEIMKEWRPDMIFAMHIAPEYPVGTIAVKEGLLFANTSELFIDLTGKGGHAAYPHQTNDMIIAACSLVTQLQSIVSRNIDPLDSAVVTIGKLSGGTVQNIIAEKARLEGTIRALTPTSMEKIKKRVVELINGIETGYQCEASIDFGSNYYQVYNHEVLTREFMGFADMEPEINLLHCSEAMTGEDFGYMLKEIPGFMFWMGVDSGFGLHHAKLNPSEDAISKAIDFVSKYIDFKGN